MISKKLLAGVVIALVIVCFISAPVLCGDGDEDPWDVDGNNPGGYVVPGGDTTDVIEYDLPGGSDDGGDLFQSIILRYGYGAWVMLLSWMDQSPVSDQAVAGKADGGSVVIR